MPAKMPSPILLSLAILVGATLPALAQRPAQTGTGGGPSSTVTAPNTTSVGQTKPPGSAGAPESPEARENRDRIEKRNDAIETGICIGCNK